MSAKNWMPCDRGRFGQHALRRIHVVVQDGAAVLVDPLAGHLPPSAAKRIHGGVATGVLLRQLLGGRQEVVPRPVVGGVGDAGLIEHVLVVVDDVRLDVAREAVDAAVVLGRFQQARPVVVQVVVRLLDVGIEVFQHTFGRIAWRRPQERDIGNHLGVAAGPQRLDLGEIVIPGLVPNLDLNLRMLLHKGIRHTLVRSDLLRAAPQRPRDRHRPCRCGFPAARARGRCGATWRYRRTSRQHQHGYDHQHCHR